LFDCYVVKFADKDRQATKHTSTTASSNANHLI